MQDCIFCKIAAGEIPSHKIYEDESVFAFLDINPVNLGHALVIPKEHHKNLLDTPPELACKLISVVQKIAPAAIKAVGADSFNLGVNTGTSAGQVIPHTHFHVIPRHESDGHKPWASKEVTEDELKAAAEKIKKEL